MATRTRLYRRRLAAVALTVACAGLALVLPGAQSTLSVFSDSKQATATATAISAYSRAVLGDSPIAYYRLDERTGTTAFDSTANARHGVYGTDTNGSVTLDGGSLPLNAGGSARISGGTVTMTGLPIPTAAGTKITADFWMQVPTGTYSGPIPFDSGLNTLYFGANGYFGFNTGAGEVLGVPAAPLQGRPVHVAIVMGNATSTADYAANRKLYIDGTLQTLTSSGPPTIRPLSSTIRISGYVGDSSASNRLTGGARISDLALYNGELAASKVQNHYYAGQTYANLVLKSNPLAYWKFDDAPGAATYTDFTQHGYTGTYPAGTLVGQAGLIRDGKPSTNWNNAGPSNLHVPTLPTTAGAVTSVEFWLDTPAFPAGAMPMLLGSYTLWFCNGPACGSGIFGVNAGYDNVRGVPWSQIGIGRHHYVVALTNNDQVATRIWIDGVEKTLTTVSTMNPTATTGIAYYMPGNVIFGGVATTYMWPYRMDEVALYNGLLPAADILAHYRTGL